MADFTVYLKSHTFVPEPGLDDDLARQLKMMNAAKRMHVLVQFFRVPDLAQRERLRTEANLRVLDPVPERAFFAAIPADLSVAKRLVTSGGVRWIGSIAPEDKIAPWLLAHGIPEHARHPNSSAALVVQFFGDVASEPQKEVLARFAADVVGRVEPLNGWHVFLDPMRLKDLAREDAVKWISEMAPPPRELNDKVRSANGVNADPVLPPEVYGLTGKGVVIAQWDTTHASFGHADYASRIVLGDKLEPRERTHLHTELVAANGRFDNGEAIYRDVDDSGTVTVGDVRATALGGFSAESIVAVGDMDAGTSLIQFKSDELFADMGTVTSWRPDEGYTEGEGIYRDADNSFTVTAGDSRLIPVDSLPAGTVVTGDADMNHLLTSFPKDPHWHATHVAGTAIGDGSRSLSSGGTSNQWKGVAADAAIRSYDPYTPRVGEDIGMDYLDDAANGATISTNSFGGFTCNQLPPMMTCYLRGAELYDGVASGWRSDGTSSGLATRMLIVGAAGNGEMAERHTENVVANNRYDDGETIYADRFDFGQVRSDYFPLVGSAQPVGTPLVNFALNELHADVDRNGRYDVGEGIYIDSDNSYSVTPNDVRITATEGYAAGSTVASGDVEVGTFLQRFNLWGTIESDFSGKDSIEVGNVTSDAKELSYSSSRGPSDDGRVKPDLVAPGSRNGGDGPVTSTWPGNGYFGLRGTSMSAPALSGTATLLTEWYRTACRNENPPPDTLRALLTHGAEDLTTIRHVATAGAFKGPDFAFGFGRVRAKEAIDLVPHHLQGVATMLGDTDYTVTIGAMAPLKVTLVWDDPAWTANAAPSPVTGVLHNDLDLVLIAPDGTQYTAWLAKGSDPFTPATRAVAPVGIPIPDAARDRRNTVEQVVVDEAMAGTWTIRVSASMLNLPPQSYTLVSESFAPQDGPCATSPAADVWMQDNGTDTGSVPSNGVMYLSPDLWNRYAQDGQAAHQNPEFGQTNYLYARVRNRNATVLTRATSVDVWRAPAATGLVWPRDFTFVGRFSAPNLAPGEVRQIGPLPWDPPPPTPLDHYCFYVRVSSPQDPVTITETTDVGSNASNSNNIVWRNFNVVDLMSSRQVTFLVRNVEARKAEVDLRIQIPPDFLRHGQVYLQPSPEFDTAWPQEQRTVSGLISLAERYRVSGGRGDRPQTSGPGGRAQRLPAPFQLKAPVVTLRGIRLEGLQAVPVTLTFSSRERARASYEVHVTQEIGGRLVGGILYLVRTGMEHR